MLTDILQFYIQHQSPGWRETAMGWLVTVIVVSALSVIAFNGWKGWKKAFAPNPTARSWTFGETLMLFIVGFVTLFIVLLVIWFLTFDYFTFVGTTGLMSGTLTGWLLFLVLSILVHFSIPQWRREFFSRRTV
jgi:hypothetical protein